MSFEARGRETYANQKTAQSTRASLEAIQVRGHVEQVQEVDTSCCVPIRAEALQHGKRLNIIIIIIITYLEIKLNFSKTFCSLRLKIVKTVIRSMI